MDIVSIGREGHAAALARLERSARRLVAEGPDAETLIELREARHASQVAAKVIDVGLGVEGTLLDLFA
jgi:hypothetical protein